jgi:sugar diacid utilization regulator
MAGADLVESERRQRVRLRELADEHEKTIFRLTRSVAAFERREQIHRSLIAVSASATGEGGIADALHELTSLTVSIEDRFGNLRAWSPGPAPGTYRSVGGSNREDVLRAAGANGQHSRYEDRIFSLIRPKTDVLGIVVLHDPRRSADRLDEFALEHAAAVLAVELSHQRSLAETELRLRRDLVEDLLTGTDDPSAYSRGEALGYDLRTPRRVTILQWNPEIDGDLIARAASRWATAAGLHPMCARRPSMTILLTEDLPKPESLHREVSAAVDSSRGWIAIGSLAASPSGIPRSFTQARRTLRIQKASAGLYGVRRFDDLGVCRILDPSENGPAVRGFLSEWLGPLMAYDQEKGTGLVQTLARYLDSGGNYDHTASALNIHRSTLRYRLGRIRDISGRDLQDVNARLNLHLASKVYEMTGNVDIHHENF